MLTRRDVIFAALIPILPGTRRTSAVPRIGDLVRIETVPQPISDSDWNGFQFFCRKSLGKTFRVHLVQLDDSVSMDVSDHIPPGYRVWEDGQPRLDVAEWAFERVNIILDPHHLRLISRGDDHDLPPWNQQHQKSIDTQRKRIQNGEDLSSVGGETPAVLRERQSLTLERCRFGIRRTYGFELKPERRAV